MALIALAVSDTVQYVSDTDPAKIKKQVPIDSEDASKGIKTVTVIEGNATTFTLRPLDVFLMGYIYDNASVISGKQGEDVASIHTRMNQTNIDTVRHGLIAFTNFADQKGNAISLKTQKANVNGRPYEVVADDVMNMFGVRLIAEMATEIKRISEVSAAEEKNSARA